METKAGDPGAFARFDLNRVPTPAFVVDEVAVRRNLAILADVKARSGAKNALLFENGDFLQGNPMGDLVAYERGIKGGETHPVVRALNQMKFDAGTLGNHEFNYGLEFLAKALDEQGKADPIDVKLGEDTLDEMCLASIGIVYPNVAPTPK